jgi:hypothetical protein
VATFGRNPSKAQVLVPPVTSFAFLMASTALVLVMVPACYAILDDLGLATVARDERRAAGAAEPNATAGP